MIFTSNDTTYVDLRECNFLSIQLTKQRCKIWSIYRPPNSDMSVFLTEIDKIMEKQNKDCIIIGDMNLNLLNDTTTVKEYRNLIEMNAFKIQNIISIEKATRTSKRTATILDHIISNNNIYCHIDLHEHAISDHKIMNPKINKMIQRHKKEKIIKTKLDERKWIEMIQIKIQQSPITSFGDLADKIQTSKTECSKEYTIKIRENKMWINKDYLDMIKKRDYLYVRWKKMPNEYTEQEFKKLKNKVNNKRKQLQKQYTEKRLKETDGDSKKMWRVLNEMCGRSGKKKNKISRILSDNGEEIENNKEIAEEFNKHFSEIGLKLASKIKNKNTTRFQEEEIQKSMFMDPTDLGEVKKVLEDIRSNCVPGIDNITKQDIIKLFSVIGETLVNLINKILENGIFPEELKTSKITPIYKKGRHDDVNNYRPISILNTFSKILEKIIKIRLVRFVQTNFGFDCQQYGFQKQSNTLGAAVDLIDYVSSEMDKNKYVVAVFIDLQKAFDTVDIQLLLEKMYKMGVRGVCYNLLRTYSTNRTHYTVVNGCASDAEEMNVGVAQGSVLGPLQYLLYVHSLKYLSLKSRYFMFADDTVLVTSASDIGGLELTVNSDLKLYFEWLCYSRLSININKTVYMVIKQKNKKPCDINIYLDNTNLKEVSEYKYLGLTITNKLSWNNHVEKQILKISPMIGAIRRCSHMLNDSVRKLLYNSFVEPHLRYLIPCWGNAPEFVIQKLQRLQNKTIKTIFSMDYYTPSKEIYKKTNILNISNLKTLEQVKLIYSMENNTLKTQTKLRKVREYHNHGTRSRENLRNEFARTNKAQNSPVYRGVMTYNGVPSDIVNCKIIKKMCHNLKTYLCKKQ